MRVMILYEHCSPHQVTVVEYCRLQFESQGHELIPVEFYSGLEGYSWTASDKPRSAAWRCLFPQQQKATNSQLYRAIKRQVKELRVDVLVINGWYGLFAWWLVFLKRWACCKIVMVSDSVEWNSSRTWLKELPKKVMLKGVDAAFVAGTPQSEYLEKLGVQAARITMGNDVVDNSMYEGIALREPPLSRKIVIGSAARLIEEKNLPAAMRALDAVLGRHPEWQVEWRIAGSGPLQAELEKLAQELQVPVVFAGFIGYYDMPGFYAGLDLYWQPSQRETWGLVVNEAMASGLPVLVSDRCGCARDLVKPGTGWIHDISQAVMEQGLEQAIANSAEWPVYGKAARELIGQWDSRRFSQGLLAACRTASNESGSSRES